MGSEMICNLYKLHRGRLLFKFCLCTIDYLFEENWLFYIIRNIQVLVIAQTFLKSSTR